MDNADEEANEDDAVDVHQLLATAAAAAEALGASSEHHHHSSVVAVGNSGALPPLLPATHATAVTTTTANDTNVGEGEFRDDGSLQNPADIDMDPDALEARRQKDRKRYSNMTPEARNAYNQHRRELYHRQGEAARTRRRERERERYHSLEGESRKARNDRRAKLERDRYNKLQKDALAERNARRRERAKARKIEAGKSADDNVGGAVGGIGVIEGGDIGGDATAVVPPLLHDVGDIKIEPAEVDTLMGEADPVAAGETVHV